MAVVDRVSELTRRLEEAILSGALAPGSALPAERALSEQMGVSRSVLREALGRLASLGLVESRHGSGTRVATPSGKEISVGYARLIRNSTVRLQDLAVVRLALETSIAAHAASARTEQHLHRLEKTQRVLANPRRSLDSHARADTEFHAILAEATGNPVFAIVLAPIHGLLVESRLRTLGHYGVPVALAHHAEILAAVRAGDSARAAAAMNRHLTTNIEHLQQIGAVQKPSPTPSSTPVSTVPS